MIRYRVLGPGDSLDFDAVYRVTYDNLPGTLIPTLVSGYPQVTQKIEQVIPDLKVGDKVSSLDPEPPLGIVLVGTVQSGLVIGRNRSGWWTSEGSSGFEWAPWPGHFIVLSLDGL